MPLALAGCRRRPDAGGIAAVVVARHPAGGPARLGVAVLDAVRTVRATVRSLRIYYGNRARAAAIGPAVWRFIQPGDLVFDVGAHVGDRVASFRRLGARVVAVEPQHAMARVLRLLYRFSRAVAIEEVAVGREPGRARMLMTAITPRCHRYQRLLLMPRGMRPAGKRSVDGPQKSPSQHSMR